MKIFLKEDIKKLMLALKNGKKIEFYSHYGLVGTFKADKEQFDKLSFKWLTGETEFKIIITIEEKINIEYNFTMIQISTEEV